MALMPQGWPAYWGRQSGLRGRMVHVRCGRLGAGELVRGHLVAGSAGDQVLVDPARPARRESGSGDVDLIVAHVLLRVGNAVWAPERVDVAPDGPRTILHASGPIAGTMLKANAWFYAYPDSRVVPFELLVVNCDQTTEEFREDLAGVELVVPHGTAAAVDFHHARGGGPSTTGPDGESFVQLHGETWLGHGQGAAWTGRVLVWRDLRPGDVLDGQDLVAAADAPLVGMCTSWDGAWGPWGVVPERHPALGVADRVAQWGAFRRRTLERGSLWSQWPWGLNDNPKETGAQQDFGVTKLAPAFVWPGGAPEHLWQLIPSVLRDAGRNSHFYENSGLPLSLALHPQWQTWGYTTGYSEAISKDRLGKPAFGVGPVNTLLQKDFAHCSSNTLAGWTALTGSELGKHLCRNEITCFVRWGRFFGLGEERAHGRAPLSAVWNYLATADARVFEGFEDLPIHDRFDFVLSTSELEVRPFGVGRPDRRYFGGRFHYWNPWHQGLAIQGLDAVTRVWPNERLDEILDVLCRTHVEHGWVKLDDGPWIVGYAVRWLDGRALTAEERQDPDFFAPSFGTNFSEWCWPAVKIARRRLATKAPQVADRAAAIDAWLEHRWRTSPPRLGLGRLGRAAEWKAVR